MENYKKDCNVYMGIGEKELLSIIDSLRSELHDSIAEKNDLQNSEVINISIQLDHAISKYNELYNK